MSYSVAAVSKIISLRVHVCVLCVGGCVRACVRVACACTRAHVLGNAGPGKYDATPEAHPMTQYSTGYNYPTTVKPEVVQMCEVHFLVFEGFSCLEEGGSGSGVWGG